MNTHNFKKMLENFFAGRYGTDALNLFLLIMSVVFLNIPYVFILSYVFLTLALYRMLSRNKYKRQQELNWYNKKIGFKLNNLLREFSRSLLKLYLYLKTKYKKHKKIQEDKKYYIFFKCKSCGNNLRVPKDKGKIKTTCPVCKNETIRKT